MMETFLAALGAAALLGLAGSLHCSAMCGGIAATLSFAIPEPLRHGGRLWLWQLLLGLGRVTTYCLLGAGAGALGQQLLSHLGNLHWNWAALASGVLMLLLALQLGGLGAPLRHLEALGRRLWRTLSPLTGRLLPLDRPYKAVLLGLLWGFLPCGLLYSALVLAAATGHAATGAATMLLFGLITIGPVAGTGIFAGRLARLRQGRFRYVALVATLLLAGLFFYQGLAAPHPMAPLLPGQDPTLHQHDHHHHH